MRIMCMSFIHKFVKIRAYVYQHAPDVVFWLVLVLRVKNSCSDKKQLHNG